MITLQPLDSAIWRPPTTSGVMERATPGIVIAEKAARDLGVGVGDELVLRHPVREGLGYRMVESRIRVEAVHGLVYRFVAFMDTGDASIMNLDGVYNTVTLVPSPGTSLSQLQRTLFALPGVGSVQSVRASAELVRDVVAQLLDVLLIIEIAVLGLAILIAFNSSAISADERAREHATMFAFGVPTKWVLGNAVVESVIVGTAGVLGGIALGGLIVRYITNVLLPSTMPELTVHPTVSFATMVTAVVVGIGAVTLAPLFTARRLRRMNIPATLRVVE
jgi:putative ABC transport system permease protein